MKVEKSGFLPALEKMIKEHLSSNNRPVVIFSSIWPFLKEMQENNTAAVEQVLDVIIRASGDRSILMPTFTSGYIDGVCNLDTHKSTTGVLTEQFRLRPGVERSLSAFFSYSIMGPDTREVADLVAKEAWGENSVYEWMEKKDVNFLMLGTHPTHCSYLHRYEWVLRDKINFRFNKFFSGTLIRDDKSREMTETLLVRRLDPPVLNHFTDLWPFIQKAGVRESKLNGISIVSYTVKELTAAVLPVISADPLCIVKNRKDFEN